MELLAGKKNGNQFPDSIISWDHLLRSDSRVKESLRFLIFIHFPKNEPAGFQVFTGCDDYLLLHCVRHLSLTSCHERIKNEILKANNQPDLAVFLLEIIATNYTYITR